LDAFEQHADDVRKEDDTEHLHKLRVTSRRIRLALPLLAGCFPKKSFKTSLKKIKKVAQSLGMARDKDVQMIFLRGYLDRLTESNSGVQLLLARLRKHRSAMQTTIISELDELNQTGILWDLRDTCEQIKTEGKSNRIFANRSSEFSAADRHISKRLDQFLGMEDCVHREDDVDRQHKMRIRAKWLRYTMELFSSLYNGELKEHIAVAESFQDTLGQMHDCDVWIGDLPQFMTEITTELVAEGRNTGEINRIQSGLLKFLQDTRETKRSKYREFVTLWDRTKESGLLEGIRQITSRRLETGRQTVEPILENEKTKIAIFADIHGNIHALNAVIADARSRGIDMFLNAGDLVGYGVFPNEVIDVLRSTGVRSVVGNYDIEVIEGHKKPRGEKGGAFSFAIRALSNRSKKYLGSLPRSLRLQIKGKRWLMTHGSPESINEHIYMNTSEVRLRSLAKKAGADVIILGHSHRPFCRTVDNVTFINPGSVGRPDDRNPKASYAIVGTDPLSVDLIRVDYDLEAAVHAIRKKDLPENLAQMLLHGVSLSAIARNERQHKRAMKDTVILRVVRDVAAKYGLEKTHSEQVRKLALKIFDRTRHLHNLGSRERAWLSYAAILHDIGWIRGRTGHNKVSLRLVLNDTELPFTQVERYIVGSIVRYHRKALPQESHYNLRILNVMDKLKAITLSSLMRVADGLDISHGSIVHDMWVRCDATTVTLTCSVNQNPLLEVKGVDEKRDLFQNVFKRELIIVWKERIMEPELSVQRVRRRRTTETLKIHKKGRYVSTT
jgi:putative phosphoesterase